MLDRRALCRVVVVALVVVLAVGTLGVGLEASARKKKKKKNQTTAKAPSETEQVLHDVNKSLVAYDTESARALLEPLGSQGDAAVVTAWGQVLQQEKDYSAAAGKYREAADLAPSDPEPLVHLGFDHLYAQRKSEAKRAFQDAADRAKIRLEETPDDARALYHLGVAQQRLGNHDQSLETLQRARDAAPKDPMVVFQMGVTRALKQDWQPALDLLTEALDMNSRIAYAYYYRGLATGG